jgi:hypothetical protein
LVCVTLMIFSAAGCGVPFRIPLLAGLKPKLNAEESMRKLIRWAVAIATLSAAVTVAGGRSQAGIIAPLGLREAADELALTETVQFTWRGRRYCWYNAGWRGAGWYRCGYRSRRGLGWGGPAGWHGWHRPGHRPVARPPRPGRPGIQRPRPLPQPI